MRKSFSVRLGIQLALVFSLYNAKAQLPDTLVNNYFTKFPNEQAYLRLDNNCYLPGDTIWFRGYILDNGVPSLRSRNLYVDWFDSPGNRIARQVLPVINGVAAGQYGLPQTMNGSRISVVAYTRWMLNDSNAFVFHRDITLLQPPGNKLLKEKSNHVTPLPELRFFPEGGFLVKGIINKVAFKASWQDGRSRQIRGVIRDSEGHSLTSFASVRPGIGYFYLNPGSSQTYISEWSDSGSAQMRYRAILPPAISSGISMEVHAGPKERTVMLRRSSDLSGWYYLMATFDGSVTYLSRVNLETKDSTLCHIPVESYPDGILMLTVLDSSRAAVAERMVFLKGANSTVRQDMIDIRIEQKGLTARGKNQLLLKYAGSGTADLSIAVTDAAVPADITSDMSSYLSFYGLLKDQTAAADPLDCIALTSQWKRNDWKTILSGQPQGIKYPMDSSYFYLSGKALNAESRQGKSRPLSFLIRQRGYLSLDTLYPTADGSIKDTNMILFDSTWIQYRPEEHVKKFTFAFDQLPPPAWDKYPFPPTPENEAFPAAAIDPGELSAPGNTVDLSKRYGKTLQTFVVSSKKRVTRSDSLENVYESPRFLDTHGYVVDLHGQITYNSFQVLINALSGQFPGLPPPYPKTIKDLQFYVDEMPVRYEVLKDISLPPIVFVKYYPRGGPMGGGASMVLYSEKYNAGAHREKRGISPDEYLVTGYTPSLPYDSLTHQPAAAITSGDLRRTLYWNPSVALTPKDNTIRLSFSNNDLGGPIRIIIEGMDEDGNLIHAEKLIKE